MLEEKEANLALYRIEKAKEMLKDANNLFKTGSFKSSNNRAYYSIFHSMSAVLALRNIDFKKHSALIQYFQREFIKTNIFEKEYSNIIMSASKIRNASDYDDFFIASKDETLKQIQNADRFYKATDKYIKEFINDKTFC